MRAKLTAPAVRVAAWQIRLALFAGLIASPVSAVQKSLGSSLTEPSAFSSLEITANSTGACSGPDCGCPHSCSGHGTCSNGVCQCFPGFTYYDCSLRMRLPAPKSARHSSDHRLSGSVSAIALEA